VDNIEASRYDAGTAYLTVDGHQVNVRDPFVYKTSDYGKTWTLITGRIPHNMLSYAHCRCAGRSRAQGIPLSRHMRGGCMFPCDDGKNWQPLQSGPAARAGLLADRSGKVPRSGGGHLRARLLDSGRHYPRSRQLTRRSARPRHICCAARCVSL